MDVYLGLYIALIGAGSALLGALITNGFSYLLKKADYNSTAFDKLREYRISSHHSITTSLYRLQTKINNMHDGGGPDDAEGIFRDAIKCADDLPGNALWADTDFLMMVGDYLEYVKTIRTRSSPGWDDWYKACKNKHVNVMLKGRHSSGVGFLNKRMSRLLKSWWRRLLRR